MKRFFVAALPILASTLLASCPMHMNTSFTGDNSWFETGADNPGEQGQGGQRMVSEGLAPDEVFVRAAILSNLAEVQLGQLGVQRASDPELRRFAQVVVDDHTLALRELEQLASQNGIPRPSELSPEHRDILRSLQSLSGRDFDREFSRVMLKEHAKAVLGLREQAVNGRTQAGRSLAQRHLPALTRHLQHAEQVATRTLESNLRFSDAFQNLGGGMRGQDQWADRGEQGINVGAEQREMTTDRATTRTDLTTRDQDARMRDQRMQGRMQGERMQDQRMPEQRFGRDYNRGNIRSDVDAGQRGVDGGIGTGRSGVNVRAPGADVRTPGVDVRSPGADVRSPGVDVRAPGADVRAPGVDVRGTR